jgi:DNA topoisomerase-3
MKLLLTEGKTAKIRGFLSKKSGKLFDACLKMQDGKAVFDFGE